MRLPAAALILLLAAAVCVLVGLGVWQLQRNEWKQDLVQRSHSRTDAPAIVVGGGPLPSADDIDYRRVTIEGSWAASDVMYVTNRIRHATRGEEIVVPLRLAADQPAILVNLGWIPEGVREDVVPPLLAESPAVVEGLARDAGERDARRIPSGTWTGLSPDDMGAELGYAVADWFVIAGPEREGAGRLGEELPIQGWQRFQNTTPHIEYALTWFGLAVVLLVVAVFRLIIEPRRNAARDRAGNEETGGEPR